MTNASDERDRAGVRLDGITGRSGRFRRHARTRVACRAGKSKTLRRESVNRSTTLDAILRGPPIMARSSERAINRADRIERRRDGNARHSRHSPGMELISTGETTLMSFPFGRRTFNRLIPSALPPRTMLFSRSEYLPSARASSAPFRSQTRQTRGHHADGITPARLLFSLGFSTRRAVNRQ